MFRTELLSIKRLRHAECFTTDAPTLTPLFFGDPVKITHNHAGDGNEPHLKTEVLEAAFDREQGLPDPAAFSVPLQERILAEIKIKFLKSTGKCLKDKSLMSIDSSQTLL